MLQFAGRSKLGCVSSVMYEPPAEKYWCRMGVLTAGFTTSVCVFVCACSSMLTSRPDGFVKIDSLRHMSKVEDIVVYIANEQTYRLDSKHVSHICCSGTNFIRSLRIRP